MVFMAKFDAAFWGLKAIKRDFYEYSTPVPDQP